MKNLKAIAGLLLLSLMTFSCDPDELAEEIIQEDPVQNEIIGDSGEVGGPIDDKKKG